MGYWVWVNLVVGSKIQNSPCFHIKLLFNGYYWDILYSISGWARSKAQLILIPEFLSYRIGMLWIEMFMVPQWWKIIVPVAPPWWQMLFISINHVFFKTSALSQTLISPDLPYLIHSREVSLNYPHKIWVRYVRCLPQLHQLQSYYHWTKNHQISKSYSFSFSEVRKSGFTSPVGYRYY